MLLEFWSVLLVLFTFILKLIAFDRRKKEKERNYEVGTKKNKKLN